MERFIKRSNGKMSPTVAAIYHGTNTIEWIPQVMFFFITIIKITCLFDFSLSVGQTYSSHITNHIWKISDKYNVIGFGNTLEAIDCELLENGTFA